MLVVGLTGGIGSGKSTVATLFAKHGIPIIDADLIARSLTQPHQPAWEKILEHFGPTFLKPDQTLDRQKLREHIFNHPTHRYWLETLLHPLISQQIKNELEKIHAPYCLVVIPLLVETGPYHFIKHILVVDTPEETQILRLKTRDQAKAEDLQKIIATQANREKRLAAADEVVHNTGSLKDLQMQVEHLHRLYLSMV